MIGTQQAENAAAMLLLMGGKSSRMGADKAQLLFDAQPFWKKIAQELSLCGKVYLSVDQSRDSAALEGYPYLRDQIPDIGVMGGLYTAFRTVPEELLFVCACDMPFMDHRFVRWMLNRWEAEVRKGARWDGIVICGDDGRAYPTAALYHRRIQQKLEECVQNRLLRMNTFVREETNMLLLPMQEVTAFRTCFQNINTPDDYRQMAAGGAFGTAPSKEESSSLCNGTCGTSIAQAEPKRNNKSNRRFV